MEENIQYEIWKNRLPFHSIPCPDREIVKKRLGCLFIASSDSHFSNITDFEQCL